MIPLPDQFEKRGVSILVLSSDSKEPGLFLVKPDGRGRLYWSSVSSMPFARPHFDEVLAGVDLVVSKDYPARGDA